MSRPSNWPLPQNSSRTLVSKNTVEFMMNQILTRGLYPLAFGYYEKALHHSVQRITHDNNLVILCLGGKGHLRIGNVSIPVQKNHVVFLPESVPHHLYADETTPWTIYWVHLYGHLFKQFMDFIGFTQQSPVYAIPNPEALQQHFQMLVSLAPDINHPKSAIKSSNLCKYIMSELAAQCAQTETVDSDTFDLTRIVALMEENINQPLSLDQLAKAVELSRFHFSRKFQKHTGMSPIRYFIDLKIKHSCELLDTTNDSIKRIAEQLGFDDPYYFSRQFKQVMGISPKQYRLLHN